MLILIYKKLSVNIRHIGLTFMDCITLMIHMGAAKYFFISSHHASQHCPHHRCLLSQADIRYDL